MISVRGEIVIAVAIEMYASPSSCPPFSYPLHRSRFHSHSHSHSHPRHQYHHHHRLAYSPSSSSKTNNNNTLIRPPSPSCNYGNNGLSSSSFKKPLISPAELVFVPNSTSPSSDSSDLPFIDDDDEYEDLESGISSGLSVADDNDDSEGGGGFEIQVEKVEKSTRRIRARVGINTNLETVWNLLTDYEHLADFIPGLAVCKLLDKTHNYAKIYQSAEQNLGFGLKFNAKGIVDCYEKDLESTPFGHRRDIEFKMSEGDFQIFEGKWSIEEKNNENWEGSQSFEQEFQTTLFYVVVVKPKLWLPVRLVEGMLCREIKVNLLCIREQAQKELYNKLSTC